MNDAGSAGQDFRVGLVIGVDILRAFCLEPGAECIYDGGFEKGACALKFVGEGIYDDYGVIGRLGCRLDCRTFGRGKAFAAMGGSDFSEPLVECGIGGINNL